MIFYNPTAHSYPNQRLKMTCSNFEFVKDHPVKQLFKYLKSVFDRLSISLNGNFLTGTVNSDARAALYDVQINHAQSKDTKVANLKRRKKSLF